MGFSEHGRQITASEYASLPDDDLRHELESGWLVSEPLPSPLHDRVRRRLDDLLVGFVKARGLGEVFGATGFVLARGPDTVRGPDIAFVRGGRLAGFDATRFFEGAPDLAVEILSPSNRPYQIRGKVADYLAAGCRLVWVVDPKRHRVTAYRSVLSPRLLGADDELDGGEVLPGLRIRVASIFELPPL